jgi:hypothetical protein
MRVEPVDRAKALGERPRMTESRVHPWIVGGLLLLACGGDGEFDPTDGAAGDTEAGDMQSGDALVDVETGRDALDPEPDLRSWEIVRDGQMFENFVDVADASDISVGDDVSIAWNVTPEFKAEHASSAYWGHVPDGKRRPFFRRTVDAKSGNRIFFRVPLRYPVKLRDEPVVLRASSGPGIGNAVEGLAIRTVETAQQAPLIGVGGLHAAQPSTVQPTSTRYGSSSPEHTTCFC